VLEVNRKNPLFLVFLKNIVAYQTAQETSRLDYVDSNLKIALAIDKKQPEKSSC